MSFRDEPLQTTFLSRALLPAALVASLVACSEEAPPPSGGLGPRPPMPELAAQTGAQRLTVAQYGNAIRDLFGEDINVPTSIEPDAPLDGFVTLGSSVSTISSRGVEKYEKAAFAIAEQVVADPARKASVLPCAPAGANDLDCAKKFASSLGRRVYRRPLAAAEVDRLGGLLVQAATTLGSFDKGIEFALAAMLQSPNFLYRPQVGEPDPKNPGKRRYTSLEMASKLSFFLWNSIPDEELLAAAEAGKLTEDEGLSEQVVRMIESPRAREGLRAFVTDWLHLGELDALSKDPTVFTYYSPEVGPAAREETLRVFEHLVFDLDADYRDVFLTRTTFVNPKLASMYAVPAPTDEGFGMVEFPEDAPRIGLLGHISVLALHSHPRSTSATLRGKFVREDLLCDGIPPPPVNVNTGLPDPSTEARTLRERIAQHNTDPACRACHMLMDPIGLGLENFDGIGRFRSKETDAVIDPSGNLDGAAFANARELALRIHDNDKVAPCFVRKLYSYATAFEPAKEETATINTLTYDFRAAGHRVKSLLSFIATSPGFRLAHEP
ncbi:DUF1592 domain-containing protein [Polyangium sp. 15x6]|uniref:DUF1592 domain-containing protein n=1 Tax=Polyangium sp. 15x6 TaxID=3042687 RepID=UPI00249B2C7B|nr:DUF1592 domain-containing protein [Polyangium sp. 15x6]MDI3281788.1 DUF1592 domain-containing protein [Polyangium sp. 15x6]